MPLTNLKLLVRPNPGGLADHKRFLAEEAHFLGNSGKFSDFVISSEEGYKANCHLSLLVPHSTLLQAIIPNNYLEAQSCQLCLPVSTNTLKSLLELLYTGDVSASKVEIEEIRTGLTLLGILEPGSQSEEAEVRSPLAVGVINSSKAKVAASALKLSVSQSAPTVELFPSVGEKNVLRLHRIEEEVASKTNNNRSNNNINNNSPGGEVGRSRRRRRVRSYCEEEGEEAENLPLGKVSDEIVLEGEAVTQEVTQVVENCQDCGAQLVSEWYRPPNRHDCQAMSVTVCQYCKVTVRGSWYLPPSRHHCPGYQTGTTTITRKRRRVDVDTSSDQPVISSPSPKTPRQSRHPKPKEEEEEPQHFPCPLSGCGRKCDSKKLLMLHLAITHYMEEMEELYITGVCSDGGRVCPQCGDLQPGIKLNFIRHLAMEHEVVMDLVERDLNMKGEQSTDNGDTDEERILGN